MRLESLYLWCEVENSLPVCVCVFPLACCRIRKMKPKKKLPHCPPTDQEDDFSFFVNNSTLRKQHELHVCNLHPNRTTWAEYLKRVLKIYFVGNHEFYIRNGFSRFWGLEQSGSMFLLRLTVRDIRVCRFTLITSLKLQASFQSRSKKSNTQKAMQVNSINTKT